VLEYHVRKDTVILSNIKDREHATRIKTTKFTANINCECLRNVILRLLVTSKNAVSDLIRYRGLTVLCSHKLYGSQVD
jgi:hypothetical protein